MGSEMLKKKSFTRIIANNHYQNRKMQEQSQDFILYPVLFSILFNYLGGVINYTIAQMTSRLNINAKMLETQIYNMKVILIYRT